MLSALKKLLVASFLVAAIPACSGIESDTGAITDVDQTDVERQSIGNCWLYATASWAESMHLTATGEKFDISQSYWTYWHWYRQITSESPTEIETGGSEFESFQIIRERGVIAETDFIAEDAIGEMSSRQASALAKINKELKDGKLASFSAKTNGKLVRQVLDEAWGLKPETRTMLNTAFGTTGKRTFLTSATTKGTKVIKAKDFKVQYNERETNPSKATARLTTLKVAVDEWETTSYPSFGSNLATQRRNFQIGVQKALHDENPVIFTWSVDFNAMESSPGPLQGSFNLQTLKKAGRAGSQGGHMVVGHDYEAVTKEFGLLKAGVTLDPVADKAKLDALLLPSTEIKFWRIKNSWGGFRDDRSSAPGFPGYHDLYQEYMNGPITWCPSVEGTKTASNCRGTEVPWSNVIVPPGYGN